MHAISIGFQEYRKRGLQCQRHWATIWENAVRVPCSVERWIDQLICNFRTVLCTLVLHATCFGEAIAHVESWQYYASAVPEGTPRAPHEHLLAQASLTEQWHLFHSKWLKLPTLWKKFVPFLKHPLATLSEFRLPMFKLVVECNQEAITNHRNKHYD